VQSVITQDLQAEKQGLTAGWAACAVGLAYVAISVYWGVGGTWLLATVGASLVKGNAGAGIEFAVWAAVVLKAIAAFLPLLALGALFPALAGHPRWKRWLRRLTWIEAVILTAYGLVLTAADLLAQSGVIAPSASTDHRALRWHAYLWDPWFLIWGLLVTIALVQTRRRRG
jgi:ABC-type uncharacterized transport system YnjBCD permease subunit